jgi:predicted dehydrogenase
MKTDSNSKVRVGIIGLGPRGQTLAATIGLLRDEVEISAICDLNPERVETMRQRLEADNIHPKTYLHSEELLASPEVDGVLIPTSWNAHLPLAIQAVKAGKPVAMEVGGATGCEELWELVRQAEANHANAMMMENCCWGRQELLALNMARQGLFGELLHCECGYWHDITWEYANQDGPVTERGWHNLRRNGDLYPTHGIGPIAKILDINRGNRFLTLSSVSSKARTMSLATGNKCHFNCGDVTTTIIKCANGETVMLSHSVAAPHPYSRRGMVQGTNGIWMEDKGIFIKGISPTEMPIDVAGNPYQEHRWDPIEKFYDEYDHPIWQDFKKNPVGGHGGMDTIAIRNFCKAIADGTEFPIDIYDTATWMCLTALSEQSVAMGGMPVPVPDFTCGKWVTRKPQKTSLWTL